MLILHHLLRTHLVGLQANTGFKLVLKFILRFQKHIVFFTKISQKFVQVIMFRRKLTTLFPA